MTVWTVNAQPSDPELCDQVRSAVARAVEHVAGTPDHRYSIGDVRLDQRFSPLTGTEERVITIRISTSDRPLLLGQYSGLPLGGLRGYNCSYLYGWIYGELEARYGAAVVERCRLALDVHPQGTGESRPYRYIGVDDAIAEGVIRRDGDLYKALRKHSIAYVLMAGPVLSGPSLGMMTAIQSIVEGYRVATVLDLFSGSGALAKVALDAGAERVISVDSSLDDHVHAANVGALSASAEAVRADAHSYQPAEPIDLVICDPFYEFAEAAIEAVAPRARASGSLLIINLGPREGTYWTARLRHNLEQQQMRVATREIAGEVVGVCEN
jgi:16S rRNA G966 N2-methylase RsmD